MTMKVYGSLPSPYVRRVRMMLEGLDYQFEPVDVYDNSGRAAYGEITPIKKLPVLVDGEQTIFDSHVICEYLRRKKGAEEFSIEQQNLVSVVDSVNDALIILFLSKRSGLDVGEETMFFKLQMERIPSSLVWLNSQAEEGAFTDWHIGTIALISLLDWAEFRELYDFTEYPALLTARDAHQARAVVQETYPE